MNRQFQVHWGQYPGEKGYVVTEGDRRRDNVVFTTDNRSEAIDFANQRNPEDEQTD